MQWKDLSHLKAMHDMSKLVKKNDEMETWLNAKKIEFDLLEED